ncbi:MAG: helix-turn-helix domain-containing protein [Chloroflexi bacterium]|nr:MAG: helix-turn-helix domain-containing protein [Chloroflexota bacterium]
MPRCGTCKRPACRRERIRNSPCLDIFLSENGKKPVYMYFPTTRVLTVLELLQSHRQLSGPDIAERLEVNPRTVRRYITMLQDLGIPVEAERGR